MEKGEFLRQVNFGTGEEKVTEKKLSDFLIENKDLPITEFYEKFERTFPYLDKIYQTQKIKYLKKIESHLNFFKIVTIISLIIGLIAIVYNLNKL